jgi:TctA family transporter
MGPMLAIVVFVLMILFPVSLVVFNRRFSGRQKLVGVLVSVVFSWLGFIVFYVLNLLERQPPPQGAMMRIVRDQ